MKLFDFKENKSVKDAFLAMTIILGFIFIVIFASIYVSDVIRDHNACGCVVPIPYMIAILSSLGLFVGSLVFYILMSKHLKEKKKQEKNAEFTLKFLDSDERKIMRSLIENGGEMHQSEFEKATGFHRVKVHRVVEKLAEKQVIIKEDLGRVNKIRLPEELKELYD